VATVDKPKVSVLLTRVGVNMGDHAEAVVTAVDVENEETIGQVVARLLTDPSYDYAEKKSVTKPNPENYLTIRVVQEAGA
jgi:hypothetical protein